MTLGNFFFSSSGAAAAYEIEQSLRFNNPTDAHYLNRTPSTDGNRRTFTYSGWHKFVGMPDASNFRRIFGAKSANTDSGWFSFHMREDGDNRLEIQLWNHSVIVDNRLRDFSAWYHLVLAVDTTQATATDRVKVYINGTQATYTNNSGSGISGFSQNLDLAVNDNAAIHNIGNFSNDTGGTNMMPMYAAEIHFVDGTALDQYDFGEFDDNNVWRPIEVSGLTYGTNGCYLNFSNSSNLGEDQAGSNDWTANNFTTSGTGTDVFSDTPTTNYATLNPAIRPYTVTAVETFSEGNLQITNTGSGVTGSGWGTFNVTSGKWYYEATVTAAGGQIWIGWSNDATKAGLGTYTAALRDYGYTYKKDGNKCNNSATGTSYGASYTTNDVIGVALDIDGGTLEFYKNGTSQGTAFTGVTATGGFIPGVCVDPGTTTVVVNFGQRAFAHTLPSGFSALNTSNLPAPDIADPATAFDVVTYEGTGTTNTLTVDFSPNFAWIKRYDDTGDNILVDTLRGSTPPARLITNTTLAELTSSDGVNSFSSTGVVLDGTSSGGDVNQTSRFYWAAQWDGNGTGTTNTAGDIDSTVSANATAGFSIVNFYPTVYDTATTVGHGLGVPPEMIIVKSRGSSANWDVYHSGIGASKKGILNDTGAFSNSGAWGSTAPTSTVFTFNPGGQNNNNHIAYCFTSIEGYSKVGAYEGNGNNGDGPFVYLGFKPKFIIFRNADSSDRQWSIMNNLRIPYNGTYARTRAESNIGESAAADSAAAVDFLSNGFKLRGDSSNTNRSGETHIYLAFAENPFGGEGVSPATAR